MTCMPAPDPALVRNPLALMHSGPLISLRSELVQVVRGLRVLELVARIEEERKGNMASPNIGGRVSGTRSSQMPVTVTKKGDIVLKDARDRTLERKRQDYENALRKALAAIQVCVGVEADLLAPVHVATQKERRAASDMGVDCRRCCRPVACTPADRLRAGLCRSCYDWFVRAGRPDIVKPITVDEP